MPYQAILTRVLIVYKNGRNFGLWLICEKAFLSKLVFAKKIYKTMLRLNTLFSALFTKTPVFPVEVLPFLVVLNLQSAVLNSFD